MPAVNGGGERSGTDDLVTGSLGTTETVVGRASPRVGWMDPRASVKVIV